jgi:transcriptional regulator
VYQPKHFSAPSQEAIDLLVKHYPLAQLVTADAQGQWLCNPIPLFARGPVETGGMLIGHVAKANPLWQHEGAVLAIFTGPQTYITPNAYPSKAENHRVVPTYNYATVQVRGSLVARTDTDTKHDAVAKLTHHFEQHEPTPWAVSDAPEAFVQANLNAIVAFEIRIESVQAKFKLSQNKSEVDRAGVMAHLALNPDDRDNADMLKLMQRHNDHD